MSGIFAPDSALMRFLTRIADLMILNLVFIATSIPIVTIGAALTGLNFTAMRLATRPVRLHTGDYFRSFRRNFRQATLIWLLILLLAAVLGAWYVVVATFVTDAVVQFILLAIWYLVAFVFALNVLFVFPYLANFEGTIREVLRNARLLSGKHLLTSLIAFAIIALSVDRHRLLPAGDGVRTALARDRLRRHRLPHRHPVHPRLRQVRPPADIRRTIRRGIVHMQTVPISRWVFALADEPGASAKGYDDSSWRSVTVPHDWSVEQDFSPVPLERHRLPARWCRLVPRPRPAVRTRPA